MVFRIERLVAASAITCCTASLDAQEGFDPTEIQPFGDLVEVSWSLDEQGRTLMRPSCLDGDDPQALFFDWRTGGGRHGWLADWFLNGGAVTYLLALCPGSTDVASLCDVEHHLRRLGYGMEETDLLPRLWGDRDALAQPTPRRGQLDRLLAVRLAASRGYRSALPALRELTQNDEASPILRRAAAEAAAQLEGNPPPAWTDPLPPVEGLLARLPAESEAVAVLHFDAMPDMQGLTALGRRGNQERGRLLFVREANDGEIPSFRHAARLMQVAGMVAEGPYELARVFGNVRVRRVVAGVSFDPVPVGLVIADGLFSPAAAAAGLRAQGIEGELRMGRLTGTAPDGISFELTDRRLTLRRGEQEPFGEDLAELGDARPQPTEAYWFWGRSDRGRASGLPFLAGFAGRATLGIAFTEGLVAELRVHYESADDSGAAVRIWQALPDAGLAGVPAEIRELLQEQLRGYSARRDGTAVVVQLRRPGFDMTDFVGAFMRAALKHDSSR